jgi:hypothetical protein
VKSLVWRKAKTAPTRRGGMSSVTTYRLIVGGSGIVYEGISMLEANRQFRLFVIQSKAEGSGSFRESVTLFKNYEIIKQYNPPDRE